MITSIRCLSDYLLLTIGDYIHTIMDKDKQIKALQEQIRNLEQEIDSLKIDVYRAKKGCACYRNNIKMCEE